MTTTLVRTERRDKVLVIIIDNPPVNAGSLAVRSGIAAAIDLLARDPALEGAVLIGAGSTFIAGSDLREFGKPLEAPELPQVIASIEDCATPVVAALHGAALGGGFELALGCDARVGSPGLVVGLPEVTLGMIPGAGGTQRLPRIVGLPTSIEWICAGTRVPAAQALEAGVLDALAEGALLDAAIEHLKSMRGRKRLLRNEPVPPSDDIAVASAEERALKAGKGRPQVREAIAAVKMAAAEPVDVALLKERAVFTRLRLADEAFALRHLFFAERNAPRRPELARAPVPDIGRIALIGAGLMGTGIAIAALDAGLEVTILEQSTDALTRGRMRIEDYYQSRVEGRKLDAPSAAKRLARLAMTSEWTALASAQFVIEAVFENLDVKQQVFRSIDRAAPAGAILATNTSYLDVDAIARATTRPQSVIGLHFFSPANLMKLVEVVRGSESSDVALSAGLALAKKLRKLPVLTGNAFGFVGNRIFAAYRRHCEYMLEDGATPQEVDAALESFGFAMGPFAVADMSGLDIAWRMRQATAFSRDPAARYCTIPDLLCEMARFGRKSGAGYYSHEGGGRGKPDAVTLEVIRKARESRGRVAQPMSVETIQLRAMAAIVNEAALVLEEGVTDRPEDIDVVLVNGYGFPRWEGGPIHWARRQPASKLELGMKLLQEAADGRLRRGNLGLLLEKP